MRLIKNIILVIAMLINTAAPAGSLYVNCNGITARVINDAEQEKYEKVIESCEEAASKDYINTFNGKEDEYTVRVYYVNKHYTIVCAESEECRMTYIAKNSVITKGIIEFRGDRNVYDIMSFIPDDVLVDVNEYI